MTRQHAALILGSTSPYRRQLLARLRLDFEVVAPQVDESPRPNESSSDLATRLALAKAQEVSFRYPEAVVIGSDQVADFNGQPLGKPGSIERAKNQLHMLSGQRVVFHTAVAVVCQSPHFEAGALTPATVKFRQLSAEAIELYPQKEPAFDCVGSAKCESLGIALLESIESDDPTALIGLPLIRTMQLLRHIGIDPLSAP